MKRKKRPNLLFGKISRNFKLILTVNPVPKIISLVIALALYYYIQSLKEIEKTVTVPLKIRNIPENLVVVKREFPETVVLLLAGTKGNLDSGAIDYNNLGAYVDLLNTKHGENDCKVLANEYVSENIQILRITPNRVNVFLDSNTIKIIPVSPRIINIPPKGYVITAYNIQPDMVEATGPESVLNEISMLETEPIHLSGIRSDYEINVGLSPNINKNITIPDIRFYVKVFIKSEFIEQKFTDLPVKIINLSNAFIVDNFEDLIINSVNIKMPRISFQEISKENLNFYINLNNVIKTGNFNLKIRHYLPVDFKVLSIDPGILKIIVKKNKK